MRVLFDILGSTERSGGMRLHSTELVSAWCEAFPDDELAVLGGRWAGETFDTSRVHVHAWPNESIVGRSAGQLVGSVALALTHRSDYVVSLSPIVSPLIPRNRAVCFQHDWRHKKNPHEFPWHQKLYRKLWEISANHALVNICISQKAATETMTIAPRSRVVVIENGRDHARRWTASEATPGGCRFVTFGHHNNKRPELAIEAFALARPALPPDAELIVLGARGSYAADLERLAHTHGVADRVGLPGFVDDEEYHRLVSSAAAIVMASSDEGFGLPIAEAQYFGIPAIITDDSGMAEIFGDYPLVTRATPESIASALKVAVQTTTSRPRMELFSWMDTARALRDVLDSAPRGR